jgi:Tol biopolymer transport system component
MGNGLLCSSIFHLQVNKNQKGKIKMKSLLKHCFAMIFVFSISITAQDKYECRKLTSDTERKGFPSWSPDGESIIYQVTNHNDSLGNNGLWITSKNGTGAKQILKGIAEHPKMSPDNKSIVFDADSGNSIKIISLENGQVMSFLPDSIKIKNGGLPCWSPDGSLIAFVERTGPSLCVYNMNNGNLKIIFSKNGMVPLPACFTPDGENILIALMDLQTRKSSMQKINLNDGSAEHINIDNDNFYRHLAISPDGSLIVFAALKDKYLALYVTLSSGGKSVPLTISQGSHNESPSWSPDGKSLIFASGRSGGGMWIMDVDIEQLKKELKELNE